MDTPGGIQEVTLINESGLYAVLFALNPNNARGISKEEKTAKYEKVRRFKRWVTHEVLPAIRKHGGYLTPAKVEEALLNPDVIINLATQLKQERARAVELETQTKVLTPKAQSFDHFLSSSDDYAVSQVAQALVRAGAELGRNRLFRYMESIGWIYRPKHSRVWHAYQQYVDRDQIRVRFGKYEDLNTGEVHGTQTIRITPKGLHALAQKLGITITEGDLNEAA